MKRTFVTFIGKKFIPAFIISAAFMTALSLPASARPEQIIEILSSENSATVQYAGSAADALYFDVKVKNPSGDRFTLVIQGEDGTVLYSKEYTDTSFSKKIKILRTDDNTRYSISIHSSNKELENLFSISTAVKTIEDVVVTKL